MEKKLLLLVVVLAAVVVSASSAFALDPMGPPTAGLQQGEWRMGGEYMYSEMDVEFTDISFVGVDLGDLTIDDFEVQKGYFNIGAGASDNLELFLRLGGGGADIEGDSLGSGFAIGGGAKLTLFGDESVKWGVLAQISWIDLGESDTIGEDVGEEIIFDTDFIEAQFAFGPTVKLSEGLSIYGGPFIHILDGESDISGTLGSGSADLEEDSMWGGYIGAQIDITPREGEVSNGAYLFVEGLFTGDAWGVGTGIGWHF